MTNVRPTLGQEDEEPFYFVRYVKDFIDRVFGCPTAARVEDDLIFRGYYYRILIRQLRITFGISAIIFAITGFFFLDPPRVSRVASHLVFSMVSVISLGLSFLGFFRLIWRAYVLLYSIVGFVIAYQSAESMALVVEICVISLIAICLMSGLPFAESLVLAILNILFFESAALRNDADTLAMLRSNSFFTFYIFFLMYAAKTRVRGIRAQFDTLETVKVQRRKSDSIIQHMLPPFVVQKLKAKHDSVIVDHFDSVTVMFCEIVNFNTLLEKMPAQDVVQLLNDIYTAFDRLTDVHGVNKVEHIGNVYVISAGCPEVTPYHSGRVAEMGLKMLSIVRHFKKVELRLGIHTGAVMAGVIGFKKLSYHLFGDTINTASRMCSHGAIQRIHVSEATYQLLSSKYAFESRGEITVKGKGVMRTYFLDGRKVANSYLRGNFAQERNAFASQTKGAYMPPENYFRPFSGGGMAPAALASEFSHNSNTNTHNTHGARTHRSGYLAARPSTASMHAREAPPISFAKKMLSFAGTPDHTPVQVLEEEEEEEAIERYKKNIFTLRFSGEDGTEDAFRERNAHVHHVRMCCSMIFALVGFAFCGLYDYYTAKGPLGPYYALRYLFCGFGIGCVVLAVRFRQHVEFITLFVLASTQFVSLAIEVWGHGTTPISLTVVVLTMFIASMAFNVSCVRFIFTTVIFFAGFALFQFLQLIQPTSGHVMGVHSTFVVFAIAMNVISCYMQERYERDNWVHELVLDAEIDKTDALLTGLLPVSVLVELKEGRQLIADQFDQVSIMLTDIVGFTEIASRITPAQLVEMLNILFSVFDRLAEKYGVLKIATIGDAYLCIAGCPEKNEDHAERIANMALEMVESVKAIIAPDGTQVRVRIGMHTGPVIAGVVGIKMIHYQVWGDSVQIAQKMESSGKASHIHVSKHAYALLDKNFIFEPAEVVKIKNTDMATYFLKGRSNPKNPIMAMKRGYQTTGPSTPRIIDLSSSMIFQNAGSWTMKKPSSPPPLTQSQRMLSAKRYPRTPRRSDMLTPLPTHRARKMSMLVTGSRPDALELGDSIDTPPSSFILDNILGKGRSSFHESTEISGLEHAESYNYEDDVISDEYSMLGSSPSAFSDVARRGEDDDELIAPITNFSLSNGLRLTSLVVSPNPQRRLPPSPSGANLTLSHPFPNVRSNASTQPSTRARSDSLTDSPAVRGRSDSLTVPSDSSSHGSRRHSLSRSCEQPPRIRSNSLTRTNSRASDYSPQCSPVFYDSFTPDLFTHSNSADYPARSVDPLHLSPHLIFQTNASSLPYITHNNNNSNNNNNISNGLNKAPFKDSLRIPLPETTSDNSTKSPHPEMHV